MHVQRQNTLKRKGRKKTYHTHSNQKRVGVAAVISDKIEFKTSIFTTGKEGHLMIKVSMCHENVRTIIIYIHDKDSQNT